VIGNGADRFLNSVDMEFVLVPAGAFLMGAGPEEKGWFEEEIRHRVELSRPFYIQTTPVTRKHWNKVIESQAFDSDLDLPVKNVSWYDGQVFIKKLCALERIRAYRLPTEAEWEYACRAGGQGAWCFGDDETRLKEYAWYQDNAGEAPRPVGLKKPNQWGLYDMHGNVPEWCEDIHAPYPTGPVADPRGPSVRNKRLLAGAKRIIRGGSWLTEARFTRSAGRNWCDPRSRIHNVGFRLAGTL
jgi:formylglycine-generating enzyme required for sulfatase activity